MAELALSSRGLVIHSQSSRSRADVLACLSARGRREIGVFRPLFHHEEVLPNTNMQLMVERGAKVQQAVAGAGETCAFGAFKRKTV
jgi:hypothetical protein